MLSWGCLILKNIFQSKTWDSTSIKKPDLCLDISQELFATCTTDLGKFTAGGYKEANKLPPSKLAAGLVEKIIKLLDRERGLAVLRCPEDVSPKTQRAFSWLLACSLGNPIKQNCHGDCMIHVFDRDPLRTIEEGARYHQTRYGGSIHTDNVNVAFEWQYMILSCLAPAKVGGATILISAHSIHKYLFEKCPEILKVLEQPFWWECRGISSDFYQAPIITYNSIGEPCFRYLRDYLISAYQRLDRRLTTQQLDALNVLDAVLELPELQVRFNLNRGEILLVNDSQVLHGRTTFFDDQQAVLHDGDTLPQENAKRLMDRLWIKKSVAA